MTGIYIHIPFCKSKCSYCDFYSVAFLSIEEDFVSSLCKEINFRSSNEKIDKIYFGGGTPSVLSLKSMNKILEAIRSNYSLVHNPETEITLEANPDDIDKKKIKEWLDIGFNRLSIGVQALDDRILELLRRRHNSKEGIKSIITALDGGFYNVSADLIYGIPGLSINLWETTLKKIINTGIKHLSAYHLTVEKGTLMNKKLINNEIALPEDEESYNQFKKLFEITEEKGLPWYEVSNFAQEGYHSRHNSSYWKGENYLGFGPSAHSFNGDKRRWNVYNINKYIKNFNDFEEETLEDKDKLNEYFITRLRTRDGINTDYLESCFKNFDKKRFIEVAEKYLKNDYASYKNGIFALNVDGLFISDFILRDIII